MSRPESSHEARGASKVRPGWSQRLQAGVLHHFQSFAQSFRQLLRRPLSSLMTSAVIGIALSLPAGLHVLLTNARDITSGWDAATQFSLFLKPGISQSRALALAQELRSRRDVESVRYIGPDEALAEFRKLSGFQEALDALESNPLPAVLVVKPSLRVSTPESVAELSKGLAARPEVDFAQMDLAWVQRLYALMEIVTRGVWMLALLLGAGVLLVVGNTIRLAIQNRRDEIVVAKLLGATDAFIRAPFLYAGMWYGLAGGLIAVGLIASALWLLHAPAARLALLYHSDFAVRGLGSRGSLGVVGLSTVLGLLGSWIAVGRHLRDIEPT